MIANLKGDGTHPSIEVLNPYWNYIVDETHQPSKTFCALPECTFSLKVVSERKIPLEHVARKSRLIPANKAYIPHLGIVIHKKTYT